MVQYVSSPEPLATIPPVQAVFGRSGGIPSSANPVVHGSTHNIETNSRLQHSVPNSSVQHNLLQSNASASRQFRPTNIYDVIDKFNADLDKIMREDYGIETKVRSSSYQKLYTLSFDSVSYPPGLYCPDFVKFSGDDSKSTWEHIS